MNIILCHIGNSLPPHIWDCVEQIRLFNDSPTYLILNKSAYNKKILEYDVTPIYIEDIGENSNTPNDFWGFTTKRLFLIEESMELYNITDVIHIENDVMLYTNINNIELKSELALTICGDNIASAAFIFIKTYESLRRLNELIKIHIERDGLSSNNSEMTIIKKIYDNDNSIFTTLPTLPDGDKTLYDPATWGQFIGGIPKSPSYKDYNLINKLSHHYIGVALQNKKYELEFKFVDGLKKPFVIDGDREVPLNNLHIHSKQLFKYKSK